MEAGIFIRVNDSNAATQLLNLLLNARTFPEPFLNRVEDLFCTGALSMRQPDNCVRINGVKICRRAWNWLNGCPQAHRALNKNMGLSKDWVVGSRKDFFQL
ncbi:hypothetical protein D3C87_1500970 [compost metagenome]